MIYESLASESKKIVGVSIANFTISSPMRQPDSVRLQSNRKTDKTKLHTNWQNHSDCRCIAPPLNNQKTISLARLLPDSQAHIGGLFTAWTSKRFAMIPYAHIWMLIRLRDTVFFSFFFDRRLIAAAKSLLLKIIAEKEERTSRWSANGADAVCVSFWNSVWISNFECSVIRLTASDT